MRSAALDLLFGQVCTGCGRPGTGLCDRCVAGLAPAPRRTPPRGCATWDALFAYDGTGRDVVLGLKAHHRADGRGELARALAATVDADLAGRLDAVVHAPTLPTHRRRRGHDHAASLARAVAWDLRVPARRALRRGPGPAQTGRGGRERRIGPVVAPRRGARGLGTVLLIDDVTTTGSTLAASAAALALAGAQEVHARTLAATL